MDIIPQFQQWTFLLVLTDPIVTIGHLLRLPQEPDQGQDLGRQALQGKCIESVFILTRQILHWKFSGKKMCQSTYYLIHAPYFRDLMGYVKKGGLFQDERFM